MYTLYRSINYYSLRPSPAFHMTPLRFSQLIAELKFPIGEIRDAAAQLHADVNQTYDENLPYSYHLMMVVDAVVAYGAEAITDEADVLPVVFGAAFHDSIEDARLTYNDVHKRALCWMTEEQALMAAEIVYALTNDKGRTRVERAGEHYYAGIRTTPYAPMVKLADRLANTVHSFKGTNEANRRMTEVYRREWPHFRAAIDAQSTDPRLQLPQRILEAIEKVMR